MIRVEFKWKDINTIIRQLLREKGINVDRVINEHVMYEKDGTITFVYEQEENAPIIQSKIIEASLTDRPAYLKGRG